MADEDNAYGFDRIDRAPTQREFREKMQAIANNGALHDYQKYTQAIRLCMSTLWMRGYRDGLEILRSLPIHEPFQGGNDAHESEQ